MRLIRNPRLSRRGALASFGSAALSVIGLAYPGLPSVLGPHSRPAVLAHKEPDADPGFTGGIVRLKTADTLVLSNPVYTRIVRIPSAAVIWKEFDISIDAVTIGDRVMARGEPQEDGSLLARSGWVWVNITPWSGTIIAPRPNGVLTRRGRDGVEKELIFSPRLQVIRGKDLSPVVGGRRALSVGVQIGAVGLSLPDGSVRATRIWIDG